MTDDTILRIAGLSKTFPGGNRALQDLELTVAGGEIVAVVGQNGSGKSTLIKILAGFHEPDPGAVISTWGEEIRPSSAAAKERLHFIHQDLALVAGLSVVENLDLSRRLGWRAWMPNRRRAEARAARALLREFGATFPVDVPVADLTPAEQAIVAIARALEGWTRSDNLLALDEPTAALHDREVGQLFAAIRRVADRGSGVIFVSHRLDEVSELADRVVVLRDGRVVATVRRGEYSSADLVRHMTGEELIRQQLDRAATKSSEAVLEAINLTSRTLDNVALSVRAGEIVGLAGLVGSGMEQLNGVIFGARPRAAGRVHVHGDQVMDDPTASIAAGLAFVPADRRRFGALLPWTTRENITLPRLRSLRGRGWNIRARVEQTDAARWIKAVDVRPSDPERVLAQLSGGNQQKVVLAKWLRMEPAVMLLDEPTQGVDVAATAAIHQLLAAAASDGTAIVISSSDTRELVDLCDRVLVFRDGRIVSELAGEDLSEQRLVTEALGLGAAPSSPLGAVNG